jgi:DNA-binding XRE family transcriptional regulator
MFRLLILQQHVMSTKYQEEETQSMSKFKRLKALREMAGLSQWDVAKFLDRDRGSVSHIENGHLVLKPQEETKLIEYLEEKARARYADVLHEAAVIV